MDGSAVGVASLVGHVSYSIVSLVIGVRLLLLARRTRQAPELLVGIMFLSGGFLGHTLVWLPRPAGMARGLQIAFYVAAMIFVHGGCVAALFAVKRLFRPDALWATVLVGVILAATVPAALPIVFVDRAVLADVSRLVKHPLYWGWVLATVGPYAWMAWESLWGRQLIRRRLRLGLRGNPSLAYKMGLWGLASGAKALMFVSLVAGHFLTLAGYKQPPQGLVISALGLIASLCIWLAFFPRRAPGVTAATPAAT